MLPNLWQPVLRKIANFGTNNPEIEPWTLLKWHKSQTLLPSTLFKDVLGALSHAVEMAMLRFCSKMVNRRIIVQYNGSKLNTLNALN